MSANPYDRRRGPGGVDWADGGVLPGPLFSASHAAARSPLAIEDLEALVVSARRREIHAQEAVHHEELRKARREAWAQGHGVGSNEGANEVIVAFERRFGGEIMGAWQEAMDLLRRLEEEPRRVSRSDLAEQCRRLKDLLYAVQVHAFESEA